MWFIPSSGKSAPMGTFSVCENFVFHGERWDGILLLALIFDHFSWIILRWSATAAREYFLRFEHRNIQGAYSRNKKYPPSHILIWNGGNFWSIPSKAVPGKWEWSPIIPRMYCAHGRCQKNPLSFYIVGLRILPYQNILGNIHLSTFFSQGLLCLHFKKSRISPPKRLASNGVIHGRETKFIPTVFQVVIFLGSENYISLLMAGQGGTKNNLG